MELVESWVRWLLHSLILPPSSREVRCGQLGPEPVKPRLRKFLHTVGLDSQSKNFLGVICPLIFGGVMLLLEHSIQGCLKDVESPLKYYCTVV